HAGGARADRGAPDTRRRAHPGRRRRRRGKRPGAARGGRASPRLRQRRLRRRSAGELPRHRGRRDVSHLERAIELAERGRATTYPNPVVGAVVIASDGTVAGEGWHERRGEPHAEIHALRAAGARAQGATMVVTLEPCTHHGTTPPCTDAIVGAGIRKVV